MKSNFTIEDYQILKEENKNIYSYALIIIVITIGILMILFKLDFQVYEKHLLLKDNNSYILIIDSTKIDKLKLNPYIYINQKKYKYKIIEIIKEYSNIDNTIYQTVHINPYNYKTDAIITECYFLKSKKTIYEIITNFIRGGIGWTN